MSSSQVEVTVRDRASGRTGVYRCEARLLRETMRYFEPAIAQQEAKLSGSGVATDGAASSAATPAATSSPSSSSRTGAAKADTPITLQASCELPIFEWLMQWMYHRDEVRRDGAATTGAPGSVEVPVMTSANAISLLLSSTFLQIPELPDEAIWFVSTHFASIVDSNVDLDCISGELLARLSAVVRPADVARALLGLEQRGRGSHPNRRFITALLRHLTQDYRASDAHLRWCRLCHALLDDAACQTARKLAGPQALPPLCPALLSSPPPRPRSGDEKAQPAFVATTLPVGPRGEIYDSHAPSALTQSAQMTVPPLAADTMLSVELWSWRVLGAAHYAQCRHCAHLVSLIEAPVHHACCPAATSATASYTTNDFLFLDSPRNEQSSASRASSGRAAGNSAVDNCRAVLTWFFYAIEHDVYALVPAVLPSCLPPQSTDAACAPSASTEAAEAPAQSPLRPLVCTDGSTLAKMRTESISLPDVPMPTSTASLSTGPGTGKKRGGSAGAGGALQSPSRNSTRARQAQAGSSATATTTTTTGAAPTPSLAALHHSEAKLSRGLEAQRLAACRTGMAAQLKDRYGITAPLLLCWRQLPLTVVQEVATSAGVIDTDIQTYVERQIMWDLDDWTHRASVKREPVMRLSLSTASACFVPGYGNSPAASSPLVPSFDTSPRPLEEPRANTLTNIAPTGSSNANATSKRRTTATTTTSTNPYKTLTNLKRPERRATEGKSGGGAKADSGRATAAAAAGTAPAGRPKLSTRVSNPYVTTKPVPGGGGERRRSSNEPK